MKHNTINGNKQKISWILFVLESGKVFLISVSGVHSVVLSPVESKYSNSAIVSVVEYKSINIKQKNITFYIFNLEMQWNIKKKKN